MRGTLPCMTNFLFRITILLALLFPLKDEAANWWASSSGSTTNGTYASPWSINYATGNDGSNPYAQPGDIIFVKNGSTFLCTNYSTLSNTTNILLLKITGTPAAPLTYRAESWLGAKFYGGLQLETASNIVVWGFDISCPWATNRTLRGGSGFLPPGINEYTSENDLEHNFIHNTGHPAIGSWRTTYGKSIRGNILFAPGYDDAGNSRGSGMYLQNETNSSTAVIKGNISIFPYTTGMKMYGNPPSWDPLFDGNFVTDGDEAGIFVNQDDSPMRLPNPSARIVNNVIWKGGHEGQIGGIRLGYQTHPATGSNAVIVANYVVERAFPLSIVGGWGWNTVKSNTFINLYDKFKVYNDLSGEGGFPTTHFFDWNQYYFTNTGSVDFKIADVVKSTSQWQADMAGDSNSTFTAGFPASNYTKVVQPSSDSNFVHVAHVNWTGASSVNVDISLYFSPGDRVRIYDAQNMPVAYATNTISSSTIALDLTLTNRMEMLGSFTNTKTNQWLGFDPQLRFFVLYREALAPTVTTNVTSYGLNSTITIPSDASIKASPYPSVMRVSENWGTVTGVKVTLSNLVHTFTDDINVAITSPDGRTVMLMSDCAGDSTDVGKTFSFSTAATYLMPAAGSGAITNGQDFLPNDAVNASDSFPVPAPWQPYGTNMIALLGGSPNGEWRLWVTDDFNGDGGAIDGWYLELTTTNNNAAPIPAHRLLSWSDSINGVPGGIPTGRTQFCNVKVSIPGTNIVAVGDGATDDTAALTAAWNRCPTNAYVYMPTGRYWCATNFTLQGSYRTLRGDGTNTVLVVGYTNTSSVFLSFGAYSEQGTQRTNIVDIPIGATNTTWDSVNGLGALFPGTNGMVKFWYNDLGTNQGFASMADGDGSGDPVHYSANGSTKSQAGAPLVRFLARITGTNAGNQVFFWPPSPYYFPSNSTRSQYLYVNELRFSGLEDFAIECNGRVSSAVYMSQGMGSWIKGVSSTLPVKSHIGVSYSTLFDITECTWDSAPAYGPSQGIGLQLDSHTYGGKVYDNIGNSNFPAIELYLGASGNAITYNYFLNPQGGLAPIDNHNGHNFLNLIEGNVCYGIIQDGYFGSAEAWTLFRNWMHGDAPTFGARKILNLGHWTRNWNEVGNVWGNERTNWGATLIQSGWNNSNTVIRRFGYPNMGNDTFSGTNLTIQATNYSYLDFYVWSNHLAHANVEFGSIGTKVTNYSATITNRTLPYSLYTNWNTASAPSWWSNPGRTNAPWPPIGPDVAWNTNVIPAMMRYHNLGLSSGGGGTTTYAPTNLLNRIYYYFFRR
jgi:subtilisin-like proprotein convertase family protein